MIGEHDKMEETQDLNICENSALVPPKALKAEMPMSPKANQTVVEGRRQIRQILAKEDDRLLVVVGPCSIHDPQAALEYAERLSRLQVELADKLCIVMRVYFEKPRTTVGWKGLVYDPHLDGSDDLATGLSLARRLLLQVNEMGLPAAVEMLDPITPQYNADLVTWAAIGARTTESQTHREMASGLSMPVGFKNSTEGILQVAIDAMQAARHPHTFVGIDQNGSTSVVRTRGNHWGHLVLRGGVQPNYEPENIAAAAQCLAESGLEPAIMVDCSHANSGKKHQNQEKVWEAVLEQRAAGDQNICATMLESNLFEGNQKVGDNVRDLDYGVSITDECIGWDKTEQLLRRAAQD
jgi:3-deoxy-7-phosphoheptulonate synthase